MRTLVMALLAGATCTAPLRPAHAQFVAFEQLRDLCRGGPDQGPQFRTAAANQLLAESYRARCRLYLLGLVDGLMEEDETPERRCIAPGTPEDEVTGPLIAALVAAPGEPEEGVVAIVREVLHSRFGCAAHGTPPLPAD